MDASKIHTKEYKLGEGLGTRLVSAGGLRTIHSQLLQPMFSWLLACNKCIRGRCSMPLACKRGDDL